MAARRGGINSSNNQPAFCSGGKDYNVCLSTRVGCDRQTGGPELGKASEEVASYPFDAWWTSAGVAESVGVSVDDRVN